MGRPKKKKLELTKESLRDVLQEAYNEAVEQRITGIREANRILKDIKNGEDEFSLVNKAKAAVDLLKLVDSAIEKKIKIATLQNSVAAKDLLAKEDNDTGNGGMTEEDRKQLQQMVENIKRGELPNFDETT